MNTYTTREGDVLDRICFVHYGYAPGAMEAVLEANPVLADYLDVLPAGLVLVLPTLAFTPQTDIVRIWS